MPARFDVFLSHASTDKPLVEELARRLTRREPEALARQVEPDPRHGLAARDRGGPGRLRHLRRDHRPRGLRPLASRGDAAGHRPSGRGPRARLSGHPRAAAGGRAAGAEQAAGLPDRDDLGRIPRHARRPRGVPPPGLRHPGDRAGRGAGGAAFEGKNPYRGLELFDVEHAPLFFGREALTEWLLDALKRKPSGAENRFLAIVGASGSGKSSLARAGLMAALKDGKLDGSAAWPRAICRPGAEPFFSLAKALTGLAPESVGAVVFDRLQGRKDGERSLHVAAGLVLGEPPRAERLVVLVDQFEEVFTLCNDEAERRDFIANLLHAATVAGGRTIVVLTMRADFYPRCAAYADLAAALSDHQVLVGPMTEDELRRAIDRPARLAGLEPEPGLVELLVDDIRGRAGALPLLQFALQEVWRRREDYRLTIRTYREIGQIEGALQRKADAVYDGFTPEQQELCRRVFLRLVQPGEGSEDTRRRASLRELLPDDPAQAEAVRAIIDRLADPESRLLTTERQQTASGEGTLEVAHEALIRGWPQLRKWIETDRAGLRTHLRLTEAAKEWADAGAEAKEGTLYAGARLAVASEWAASHRDELGALEAAFLSASQEHERQQKADEAEKNRRLAEAERQRAEEAEARKREAEAAARHQKKLSQRFLIAAAVSLLLAIAAGWQTLRANWASAGPRLRRKERQRLKRDRRGEEKEKLATRTRSGRRPRPRSRPRVSSPPSPRRSGTSAWTVRSSWRSKLSGPRTPSRHAIVFSKHFRTDRDSRRSCTSRRATSSSVAFSPDGKTLAAGYGGASAAAAAWCCGTWPARAAGGRPARREGGRRHERGLQPRRQDPRRRIRHGVGASAAWCCGTWPVATRLADGPAPREGGRRPERGLQPRRQDPRRRIRRRRRRDGGVVLWDVAARKRLAERPARREGGRRHERGLQPRRQDPRRRIRRPASASRRRGAVGRGRRASGWRTDPLPVKEGDVRAWPSAPTARPSPPDTRRRSAAAAWCCGTWPAQAAGGRPAPREGGRRPERGLQPRRQDPRRRIRRRSARRRRGAVGRGRARAAGGRTRSP